MIQPYSKLKTIQMTTVLKRPLVTWRPSNPMIFVTVVALALVAARISLLVLPCLNLTLSRKFSVLH